MHASVRLPTLSILVISLICISCLSGITGLEKDPRWVETLVSQLRCGQSVEVVRKLTSREIEGTTTRPELGSYQVSAKLATIWLDFQSDQLMNFTSGRIDGFTSLRISPKKSLCTNELIFFLELHLRSTTLEGAAVYLDGKRMENYPWADAAEVSAGLHELLVEKEGYEPIIRHLELDEADPGEIAAGDRR